jgi:hypothetical protein
LSSKNRIVVYAGMRLGNVSPNIYGFNIEHIPGLIYGALFDESNPYQILRVSVEMWLKRVGE